MSPYVNMGPEIGPKTERVLTKIAKKIYQTNVFYVTGLSKIFCYL
jgi:hypothetical protein